jgi:hypothetical protein
MANEIQIAPDRPTLLDRLRSSWDGWFNPSAPTPPMAPDGTAPRQIDYTMSQNLTWLPRASEPISFQHLRMMADGSYLIRAIIEKVKDRICAKTWHFRLKPQPGEYMAATKERSNADPRIEALTNFFLFPDSTHNFAKWARMLLEDRLVIDAATLEVQRTRGGQILNLLPVDGATINVLIDNAGRQPKAPLPAYRQIIKGLPATNFTTSELVYMPANIRTNHLYGYSPVEQTLAIILTVIYKTVMHQSFYDESDIPLAYMQMAPDMSAQDMLRLMREIQASLTGDIKERSKILPVAANQKIEILKHEPFDAKFEEWAARVFCYVLGETATPFVQQNNRATAQQSDDTREESGERPLMLWFKGEIDSIIQRPDLFNAPDIEITPDEEAETDALKQAQVDQITVQIHTRTPNELRQRDGLSPIDGGDSFPTFVPPAAPSAGGDDDNNDDDPKPPKPGAKVAKAAAAQKKTPFRY